MKYFFALCGFLMFSQVRAQTLNEAYDWYDKAMDLHAEGKSSEAISLLEKAAPVLKREGKWKYYAVCECGIAGSAAMNYDLDKAQSVFNRSLPMIEQHLDSLAPELGTCYGLYAILLINQGKPKEALLSAQKCYKVRRSFLEKDNPLMIEIEKLIGSLYLENNQADSSLVWSKTALYKAEKKYPQSKILADIYNNIGNAYKDLSKEDSAITYLNKALQIRKAENSRSLDVALTYGNLALAYAGQGKYDEAEKLQLQALEIRKSLLPSDHHLLYLSYSNLAALYGEMTKYTEAVKYLELTRPIIEKKYKGTVEAADFYMNYGTALQGLGQYEQGYTYIQKAIFIFTQYYGEKHPRVATCYQNIGLIETDMGKPDKGITWQKKSIDIREALYGKNHISLSGNYINMGNAYRQKGFSAMAVTYYLQSLDIIRKNYSETHPDYIKALHNISIVLMPIDKNLCITLWHNSLAKQKKDSPLAAQSLQEIGNLFLVYNQFDSAETYYTQAEKIYQKNGQTPSELDNSIGALYLGQKKYTLAYQRFQLIIRKEIGANTHAKYLNNISLSCMGLKKWDEALQYAHQAQMATSNNKNPDIYTIPDWNQVVQIDAFERSIRTKIEVFTTRGKATQNKKDLETSVALAKLLQDFQQKMANDTRVSGESIGKNALSYMNSYILAIQASEELYRMDKNPIHLQDCFLLSERTRGFLLANAIQNFKALRVSGVPEKYIQEEAQYADFQSKLIKKSQAEMSEQEAVSIMEQIQQMQTKRDSLYRALERDYPAYIALRKPAYRSATEVQKKIQSNEAIVSYLIGEDQLLALIITQNKITIQTKPWNPEMDTWVEKFRTGIDRNSYKLIAEQSWSIYQYAFAGIDSFLQAEQIKKLIILPEGSLYFVPFEALITEKPNTEQNFSALAYLIKKYQISYAYTANLYLDSRKNPLVQPTKEYIAIAPVFNSKSSEATVRSSSPIQTNQQIFGQKTRDFLADGSYISALPGTLQEVNQVSELFKSAKKTYSVLLNGDANEKQVKNGDLKNYRYLHFATHGFVNETQPNLSGLILAQQEPSEDNILYSAEIYSLQLNADLLVLSACQTGLGKLDKGEGLIGLGRGFLYAGVRNMIVSLWSVSDAATAQLIVDFFQTKINEDSDFQTSMYKAKLNLMKNPAYASPFYWAPFILIGK